MEEKLRALVIDAKPSFCHRLKSFLEGLGDWTVGSAASTDEALLLFAHGPFDAVVTDHRPPALDGLRVLRALRDRDASTAIILFVDKGNEDDVVRAFNEGADYILHRIGDPEDQLLDLEGAIRKGIGKRRFERDLRESERKYRLLAENATDVIWKLDLEDMSFSYVSPNVHRLRGISAEEAMAEPLDLAFDPDSLSRLRASMPSRIRRFLKGEEAMRTVVDVVRQPKSDGTWVAVEVSTTLLVDEAGGIHEILGVSRDLTKRIRAEEELRESQRKLVTLMSNLPGMAYRCLNEPEYTMEFVSEGCQPLTGYLSWELLMNSRVSYASLILPEDREPVWDEVQAALNARKPFQLIYRIRRKDGKVRWVREQGQGVFSDTGELLALEGFIADITESKETMSALELANKKLGLLTSITRHDTLNMLTVIRGQVALGRIQARDKATNDALEGIDRMACNIQRAIDFTTQYQEMHADEPTWQRLDEAVSRAIDEHAPTEDLRAVNDVGRYEVYADPMLTKVFHNLIDNSIRHGQTVRGVRVSTEEGREGLRIIYEDDGLGIPAEQKSRIFERGVGRHFGFGLFLSREILGITGISITEEGVPGEGARFIMLVPVAHCRRP